MRYLNKMKKFTVVKKSKSDAASELDDLIETLNQYDVNTSSLRPMEVLLNWFIALGTGIFLTIISNFDKLLIDNKIPYKGLFILINGIILLGLFIIVVIRLLLLFRDYHIVSSKSLIQKIKFKMRKGNSTTEDEEILKRNIMKWLDFMDLPSGLMRIAMNSMILMVLGLLTLVGYYFYFLLCFK